MKLQESYFTIRKISYPNSDTRHGKFKINLVPEHPVYEGQLPENAVCPATCTLQMIKECAQIMAHEKLLFSYIKQYRELVELSPARNPELLLEIHLEQGEREGTGMIYKMRASCTPLGKQHPNFFEITAELSSIR